MLVLDYGGTKLLHLYIRVFGGKKVEICVLVLLDFQKFLNFSVISAKSRGTKMVVYQSCANCKNMVHHHNKHLDRKAVSAKWHGENSILLDVF